MATETLELVIRTTGASSAASQITNMGSSARAAAASINSLNASLAFMRKTLVALSFARTFEGIGSSISQAQSINNQLIQIAKSASDVPKAFAMFSQIATSTHAPLDAVVGLGVQIARSSASYKASAKDIGEATQTIFNTFRQSGSDPTTIKNVTKDLKEIFSLGVVQGRQFRAVILQDQAEALLLAKYIQASGANAAVVNKDLAQARSKGQLPDIYEMAMKYKGAFTGADVIRANIAGYEETNQRVAQLPTTLAQAFTDLHTKWLSLINDINSTSAFKPLAASIEYVANNLKGLTEMLGVLLTGVAIRYLAVPLAGWFYGVAAGIASAAASAVVFVARMTAVGVATAFNFGIMIPYYIAAFAGAIATADAAVGSFVAAALTGIGSVIASVVSLAMTTDTAFATMAASGIASMVAFLPEIAAVLAVFTAIGLAVGAAWSAIVGFFSAAGEVIGLTSGFDKLHLTIKDLPSVFSAFIDTIVQEWPLTMKFMGDLFHDMVNGMKNGFGSFVNSVNPDRFLPGGLPASEALPTNLPTHSAAPDIATLNKVLLANIAKERAHAQGGGFPQFKPPSPPADEVQQLKDRTIKINSAMQSLEDMLARFNTPSIKFQDNIDKITLKIKDWTTATKDAKGNPIAPLLTNAQVAAMFAKAGFDDFNASTRTSAKLEQDLAREMLGLKNATQETGDRIDFINKMLKAHNITQAEANKLIDDATKKRDLYNWSLVDTVQAGVEGAKLGLPHDLTRDIAQKTATSALELQQKSNTDTFNTQAAALNELLKEGSITNKTYAQSLYSIEEAFLSTNTDALSGFQKGLIEVQKTMNDIATDSAKLVTQAFNDVDAALNKLMNKGRLDFSKTGQDILANINAMVVKQGFMQPLMTVLGAGAGQQAVGGQGGGIMGMLASAVGGAFGMNTSNQLGASQWNPMWVQVAGAGDTVGSFTGGLGGSSGGGGGIAGSVGDFMTNLFSGNGGGVGSTSNSILQFLGLGGMSSQQVVAPNIIPNIGDISAALPSLPGFATGGSFTVGGSGGTDSQLTAFMATPGENVTIGQQGGVNVVVNDQRTSQTAQPVQVSTTTGPNGQKQLEIMVADAFNKNLAQGTHDNALATNFGIQRVGVPR